jgi:hypothetical protein
LNYIVSVLIFQSCALSIWTKVYFCGIFCFMNSVRNPELVVGTAVHHWLEVEASNSTFDRNKPLDNLEYGRQSLIDRDDPKMNGHLSRMNLWLGEYDKGEMSSSAEEMLSSRLTFGALMFLSGAYRRQRYLQASDQDDYYRRKLEWYHPGGIVIPEHLAQSLRSLADFDVSEKDIKRQGKNSMDVAEERLEVIYRRAPEDFGIEQSASVDAVRQEQTGWLAFLGTVLTHASRSQETPTLEIPILEPKSISEAELTTLGRLLPSEGKATESRLT